MVSGDLIQGSKAANTIDADSEIEEQYREADEFLRRLAAEFVNADRSRVVIVPGNHDVNWLRSRCAMRLLKNSPSRIATKAFESDSRVRWNWSDFSAYEISDLNLYEARYEHFRRFQAQFYAGLEPSPLPDNCDDIVFHEYSDLGLVVVGLASWYGNDCFCHVGEIDSAALSFSRDLLARANADVAVAVWHHSIVGGPNANDYMDQRRVHRLIDFGFNVGLHGHQHYPEVGPYVLRLPNLTSMAVVSAGSLAAGDKQLPAGESRQFNVIVIDPEEQKITVHVREMSAAGVFSASHRADFGGKSFVELDFPISRVRSRVSTVAQRTDEAVTAVRGGQFARALELIDGLGSVEAPELRQIRIEALIGLQRWEDVMRLLDPPSTADEATRLISLLLDASRIDEAEGRLAAAATILDSFTVDHLRAKIVLARIVG